MRWLLVAVMAAGCSEREPALDEPDAELPPPVVDAAVPDASPPDAMPRRHCGTFLGPTGDYVTRIVSDGTTIYWSEESGAIKKMAASGGDAREIARATGAVLALHVRGDEICFSVGEDRFAWQANRIQCAGSGQVETVVEGEIKSFDADGDAVYWLHYRAADHTSEIDRVPRTPGAAPQIVYEEDAILRNIAVDGDHVYFGYGSGINRIPKAGGSYHQPVVNLQTSGTDMRFAGDFVYWGDWGVVYRARKPATNDWSSGWNLEVREVVRTGEIAYDFAVAGDQAYFLDWVGLGRGIYRGATGGTVEPFVVQDFSVHEIAVDDDGVVFADSEGLRRVSFDGCVLPD